MKKLAVLVFVVLLLLSNVTLSSSAESVKILVDESRVFGWDEVYQELLEEIGWPSDTDWTYSFENDENFWGFGNAAKKLRELGSVDVRKSGKLSYNTLKRYDVLVIAAFEESYSSGEADAIKKFVENGGGLLLLANGEYPNNSVSRTFDVLFESENVNINAEDSVSKTYRHGLEGFKPGKGFFFYAEDFKNHPITQGIEKLGVYEGIPITSYKSGKVLATTSKDAFADEVGEGIGKKQDDEEEGPFDLIVAIENASKGRAVFVGTSSAFWNAIVNSEEDNLELLKNAVEWLGEPGGPYKQYLLVNEQAQQTLSDAKSLFESHKFTQAISELNDAISIFEESNEIYTNSEATEGIEEAQSYIQKCETGIEADTIFDQAEELYEDREYEDAITEYQKAESLYEEIEYTERAEECVTRVDESEAWIALREKAKEEYSEAEDALSVAPSTFDPAGYEKTKALFEKAKSTWEEYDDPEQEAACQEKIELCNDEIEKIEKNRMMVIIGVIVIIVGVVVIVIVVIRRRKPKVTEAAVPEEGEELAAPEPGAVDALQERYAKGEITKEEYEKLKSVLEEE